MANSLYDLFLAALDVHAPLKRRTTQTRYAHAPWISPNIKNLMCERDRIKRRAEKNPALWPNYKQLRNKVISQLKLAATSYYSKMIDDNSNNPKGPKLAENIETKDFDDPLKYLPSEGLPDETKDRKVQLVSSLVLQGRSENFVTVKCDQSFSLVTGDFEPVQLSESPGVYATRCRIIPNIEGCFQVSFLNINPCSVSIPANTHIGFLTTSNTTVAQIAQQDKSTSTNLEDSIVYGENLSNDEKTKILDIISNFKTIFAPNPKKPTLVRNMEHKIITNDAQPVKRKPYRIPYAYLEETEKQITEMLNNDIIRPSSSPWNAPLSKCVFASAQVDFLGFELSRQGIRPQSRLTDAIRSYQQPSTKKELKAFLGLTGFYRAFIPDFTRISQPLNALTSDHVQFNWSYDCEEAFINLKEKLSSKPVLVFPDLHQTVHRRSGRQRFRLLVVSRNNCRKVLYRPSGNNYKSKWTYISHDARDKVGLGLELNIIPGGHLGFGWKASQGFKRRFHKSRISYYSNRSSCITHQLLYDSTVKQILESGDVSQNPGPVKCPCCICGRAVAKHHRAIQCDSCDKWCHIGERCGKVKLIDYQKFMADEINNLKWYCPHCKNTEGISPGPRPQADRSRSSQGPTKKEGETHKDKEVNDNNSVTGYATLTEKLGVNKNHITMAHINIAGLLHKIAEVRNFINTTNIDILAITETHLDGSIDKDHLGIEGYAMERRDRQKEDYEKVSELWGGVVIYYKENLKVVSQQDRYGTNMEAIWIEIISHSQRLLVGALYRHPKDVKFFDKFNNTLEKIWMNRKHLVIMGDLNSDLNIKGKNKDKEYSYFGKKLSAILKQQNLYNIINKPTRITKESETIIDLIICSTKYLVKDSGVAHIGVSDHSLVYVVHKIKKDIERPEIRTVKDFKKVNMAELREAIKQAPWSVCSVFEDVDDTVWAWNKLYKEITNEFIPVRKVKSKKSSLPWINGNIRKLMNKRLKTLQRYSKTKETNDWMDYVRLRNKVKSELRKAEAEYYTKKFEEANDPKDFWALVRKVSKPANKQGIKTLQVGEEIITDSQKKAEVLNDFFTNIGKDLGKAFDADLQVNTMNMNRHIYRITPCLSNIVYPEVNHLQKICDKQKPGKGCGDDNITSKEVKELCGEFSLGLKEVLTKSISTCKYPSLWKTSKVTAVFKKGATKERENYRPISLLSIPSKIYETIISENLDKHIENYNLSTQNQWGFKKGLNTESTLLYLTETWKQHIEEGKVVGVIFVDFRKAFDTVNHIILAYKLKAMGITGDLLNLLQDYLANRNQFVNVKGKHSDITIIEIGVPQGSLLGPRLFAIYVNDFPSCTKIGEIHLYADDTTAFVVCNTIDDTIIALTS
eukprot:gene634-1302_t